MANALLYPRSIYLDPYRLPFRIMFFNQLHSPLHYHDFEELVCVLRGEATHECDGQFYHITAGDMFLIRAGSQHTYDQCHNLQLTNILFTDQALDSIAPVLTRLPGYQAFFKTEPKLRKASGFKAKLNMSGDGLEEIRMLLVKCEHEYTSRPPGYEITSEAYFRQIITLIARNYQDNPNKPPRQMAQLSQMVDFIDQNYAAKISRDDIVRSACLSVSSASRMFQSYMRKSMMEYLTEVRISQAGQLLRSSEKTITEIASLCGFEDSNYFSTQFRRQTGMSPRTYRRQDTSTPQQTRR